MPNLYTGRETVKQSASIHGADFDEEIDRLIESASRRIDRQTRRLFIPKTQTRTYRWPPSHLGSATILWLDYDLISVTTLKTKAQDSSPTTIAATDFFLEPNNSGPPYDRIEIDLSSSAAFESGSTPQRSIEIAGSWGYSDDKLDVGTVTSGLDSGTTTTSFICSDSSQVQVGNTLLIESEQLYVSDKINAALGSILLNDTLTADKSDTLVTVDGSHGLVAGEVVLIDSEKMFIDSVATNDLTVIRAYDGTVLAAHADDTAIHVYRTLTVERGACGTSAATHADATKVEIYEPPFDISQLCLAEVLTLFQQNRASWGRSVGSGETVVEFSGRALGNMWKEVVANYRRHRTASVV